jgi:hypothetical protein
MTHRQVIQTFVLLSLLSIAFVPNGYASKKRMDTDRTIQKNHVTKPSVRPLSKCPDIASYSFRPTIIKRTGQYTGDVKLTGTIKNVSPYAFEDHEEFYISRHPQETSRDTYSAFGTFSRLSPGQTKSISLIVKGWNASSPYTGEFPQDYLLFNTAGRHPDANEFNDDCNESNNRLILRGTEINRLFNQPWVTTNPNLTR